MGELAVVCQHEQPRGLGVEPADVVEPLAVLAREPSQVGAAALVAHRRDDARRLVEHDVALRPVELHRDAVDVDAVDRGIDACAEFGDDLAVHPHTTRDDEVFADAPRRDARVREGLLQALARRRGAVARRALPRGIHVHDSSPASSTDGSSGEIGGSSSSELMPRCASS